MGIQEAAQTPPWLHPSQTESPALPCPSIILCITQHAVAETRCRHLESAPFFQPCEVSKALDFGGNELTVTS